VLLTFTTREPGVASSLHHPRAGRRQQLVQQETGQREVAQVVGAHLHLEAVGGASQRKRHHAGVVAQRIQARVTLAELFGEVAHAGQAGQVEGQHLHLGVGVRRLQPVHGVAGLLRVAAGEHELGAAAGEGARRLEADARVASGDDDRLAGESAGRDVFRGPTHGGSSWV